MKYLGIGLVAVCFGGPACAAMGQELATSGGARLAEVTLAGGRLTARPLEDCARVSLTVKGPGGYWKREVRDCASGAVLALGAGEGSAAPGPYTFEVRLLGAAGVSPADDGARAAWGRFQIDAEGALVPAPALAGREPEADLTISDATPQLVFDDTDVGAIDWQARTIGDGTTFLVQNSTANTSPVTITSDAPSNSLFLSNSGSFASVGIGTATPSALGLTISSTFPRIVFDQLTEGVTWTALAGANGEFSIGETNKILVVRPGAPSRSFQVDTTGNLAAFTGIASGGADLAAASLHVRRTNGTAKLLVEEAGAVAASRNMLQIKNNGASTFRFDNTASGQAWGFGALGSGNFFVGSAPGQPLALTLSSAGNLSITGTLSQGSDRDSKTDIAAADAQAVLAKVAELPVSTWRYKGDTALHVGPMAQEFVGLFGLGADDKHIAPGDMAGLALAAIQALREDALVKDARIQELEARLGQLEAERP